MPPSPTSTDPGTLLLAVLENAGLALAVVDEEGTIVFANKKALTMWGEHSISVGASLEEWRSLYRIQDSHGRDVPPENTSANILRTLTGDNPAPRDLRVILPDGTVKWVHVISERFSVFGISGVLIIMADETEQVLLHRAMRQFEQIESLGHLTRGLIHDLNNMFAVVSENLSLARTDEGVPQVTRDRLQQLELALKRGSGLVKKLAQFSAHEYRPQPFEINRAVKTAAELARPLFGSRIRVNLALDPDLPMIEGDAAEIEQALVNLILNAVDAMPNGGELTLSTELERPAPGQSGDRRGWFARVTVADTGVGIPDDVLPRIFEPFFTTKAEKRGTGLGLPTVYGIVQRHQGEIKVHSVPGQGTRFTIYLPVRQGSVAAHGQRAAV
jgi:two-component system, cell cycle sensor histidine kinase and response regulator CckA